MLYDVYVKSNPINQAEITTAFYQTDALSEKMAVEQIIDLYPADSHNIIMVRSYVTLSCHDWSARRYSKEKVVTTPAWEMTLRESTGG